MKGAQAGTEKGKSRLCVDMCTSNSSAPVISTGPGIQRTVALFMPLLGSSRVST